VKYTAAELSETFTELLRAVAGLLDALDVPWMLVGGLAAGAWTEPRGTKDCDLAVSLTGPVVDRLRQGLEDLGLRSFHGDLAAAAGGGAVRLRLDRSGAPPLVIDLLCAGTDFEREALANRRRLEVLGVPLWIVSPDDLVLYKLIAGKVPVVTGYLPLGDRRIWRTSIDSSGSVAHLKIRRACVAGRANGRSKIVSTWRSRRPAADRLNFLLDCARERRFRSTFARARAPAGLDRGLARRPGRAPRAPGRAGLRAAPLHPDGR
jgi:hypothetical protein